MPISIAFIIIVAILVTALLIFVTWQYDSWINGLESRKVKLTLEKSGKQLHGLMNVFLFFGALSLAGIVGTLFQARAQLTGDAWLSTLGVILQLVSGVFVLIGAAAAKAWFRTGYTTERLPQRFRLLFALRGYGVVTVMQFLVYVITVQELARLTDWISLVLAVITNVVFLWGVFLTIRLIDATFGAPGNRSGERERANI